MNHGSNHLYPGESGELVNGLTNHEHQRQTQTQGAFCCAALIELEDNSLFGLKKIKRWSVMRRQSQVHLCFSCYISSPHPFSLLAAHPVRVAIVFIWVCGRLSAPFIESSGTTTALLFPAWPVLSQPPDSSRLAFSPLSSNFPVQLSKGPHWEYCSDPGIWAPKPTLILHIDRPENFLTSAAGSSVLTLYDPEQPVLLIYKDRNNSVTQITWLLYGWVLLWCMVFYG